MHHVRLLLHLTEVLSFSTLVTQAFLVRVEHNVVVGDASGDILFPSQKHCLRQIAYVADALASGQALSQFDGHLFAHAVGNHIGWRVAEQTLLQLIAPVVVVGHSS